MVAFPYGTFELRASAVDARRMDRLANIYHRGQDLIWNGRDVLADLVRKHGGVSIAGDKQQPLQRLFGTLMWGELAAWKISAQLADRIEPLGAKMAATSQVHDEARHFYVLHDYLMLATGGAPPRMHAASERLLTGLMDHPNLACKLLGMQLQVETAALTIFQHAREARICPVLSDLLLYFEKDEARHVGLGMQYLPVLLRGMSTLDSARFTAEAVRISVWLLASNRAMESDMRLLGLDPYDVMRLAKSKQTLVFQELWETAPGSRSKVGDAAGQVLQAIASAFWPSPEHRHWRGRARAFVDALRNGIDELETTIEPVAATAMDSGRAN